MADKVDIDLSGGGGSAAPDAEAELKRRLAKRMGLAVVLIAVLLGALAVFDRISSEPPESLEAPPARPPVPLPRQEMAKPVQPAVPAGSAPDAPPVTVEKTSAPGAAVAEPPRPDLPPKPEVQAQPSVPPAPATAKAPASRAEPREAAAVAEGSATPLATPAAATPATAATAGPPAPAPAAAPTARPVPTPSRPSAGYVLQAGVFASVQHAEELHAKLQLNGIASSIEARVQVGPFRTRAEADATRNRLKALGIDAVLLVPPRGAAR